MSDLSNPGGLHLRPIRQWTENGFDELTVGLLISLLGIYPYALVKLIPHGSGYGMVAPFLLLALILPFVLVTKRVREKIIFPRTGYVVFRPAAPRKWIIVVFAGLGAVQAVVAAYWGLRLSDLGRLAGVAMGLFFATCLLWGVITYKVPHYIWFAGLALLVGAATFVADLKIGGAICVMVGLGVAMALDGAFRMRRFLRTHPIVRTPAIGEDRHA